MAQYEYNGEWYEIHFPPPYINVSGKRLAVHRLEWEKYNGPIPEGYIIHHKDENRANWSITNLELMSKSYHRSYHCTKENQSNNKRNVAVRAVSVHTGEVMTFPSIRAAARVLGISASSISSVVRGVYDSCKGWEFYKED